MEHVALHVPSSGARPTPPHRFSLVEIQMAAKKTAKRAKRRSSPKPLSASAAHRLAAQPIDQGPRPENPATAFVSAAAELPARLLACRSPFEVWLAYLHFTQRIVLATPSFYSFPGHALPR
jgi:hypothetical protein